MNLLLLPPRFTEDSISIAKAATRLGWEVERLSSWHIPPLLADEDVCVYAEPLFAIHASAHLGLSLVEPTYDWLTSLPPEYVLRDIESMTMEQARSTKVRRFIKCSGEKFFAASIYENAQVLPPPETVSGIVPVLVIEPVQWDIEFRCFVMDRNVVASSPYLLGGELAKDSNDNWVVADEETIAMNQFVRRFLEDARVNLPPAVVIDVGRIRQRGWAVVEANPAWGSGLYGCDPQDALKAVRRACVKSRLVSSVDQPWVIDHAAENFI